MTWLTSASRLWASVLLLCAANGVAAADEPDNGALDEIKAAIDELKKLKQSQPQQTFNDGALAIESWLLTSTAIDSTAAKIHDAVESSLEGKSLVVLASDEAVDANEAAMFMAEMSFISRRIRQAATMQCPSTRLEALFLPQAIGAAAAIVDLLKSETELTAIDQTVDAKLLAASVAGKFEGRAIIPSAAIAVGSEGRLLQKFRELVELAEGAQSDRDGLAEKGEPTKCEQQKLGRLNAALGGYDAFYTKATTAKNGVVPIVTADRLDTVLGPNSRVLRIATQSSGGTLLKRKNLMTALGAETAFISGGLVSSYQLTDPSTGQLIKAGVVTCRTTLTSLKRVQQGSWTSTPGRRNPTAVCSP